MSTPSYWLALAQPGNVVASSTSTSITFNGLIGNTSYLLHVFGVYSDNTCAGPGTSSAIITKPTAPSSVTPSSVTNTGASLSFTAGTNGSAYAISYALVGGGGSTVSTSSPFYVTGLTGNTSYTLGVSATANSVTTTATYASPFITSPTPPSSVTVSSFTDTGASLSFVAGTNGSAYAITYGLDGGGSTVSTSSPYTITGLTGNTSYNLGVSFTANSVTTITYASNFITLLSTPTIGTATQISTGTVSVSFTSNQGSANSITYTITAYWFNNGSTLQNPNTTTGNSSPITVTGLPTSGGTWTFTVKASTVLGVTNESSKSNSVSATPSSGVSTTNLVFSLSAGGSYSTSLPTTDEKGTTITYNSIYGSFQPWTYNDYNYPSRGYVINLANFSLTTSIVTTAFPFTRCIWYRQLAPSVYSNSSGTSASTSINIMSSTNCYTYINNSGNFVAEFIQTSVANRTLTDTTSRSGWVHYVVVSNYNNIAQLYVNGALITSIGLWDSIFENDAVTVNRFPNSNSFSSIEAYMDNIKIYTRPLSSSEITQLYNFESQYPTL